MKSIKTGCGGVILIFVFFLIYFVYCLIWEGYRDVGELQHSCNPTYKFKISQYTEFEPMQSLYFSVMKNGVVLDSLKDRTFEFTNNMYESISSFNIHCYKDILFVVWEGGNIPIIIFDTRTGLLHETSKEDTIFNKIQKGNPWIKVDIWE